MIFPLVEKALNQGNQRRLLAQFKKIEEQLGPDYQLYFSQIVEQLEHETR